MTDEPSICKTCRGRGTHLTKRDHPQGAGHVVLCSGCDGTGVRLVAPPDEAPRNGARVVRFG